MPLRPWDKDKWWVTVTILKKVRFFRSAQKISWFWQCNVVFINVELIPINKIVFKVFLLSNSAVLIGVLSQRQILKRQPIRQCCFVSSQLSEIYLKKNSRQNVNQNVKLILLGNYFWNLETTVFIFYVFIADTYLTNIYVIIDVSVCDIIKGLCYWMTWFLLNFHCDKLLIHILVGVWQDFL